MAVFIDNQKREWNLYIDIPIARKIRTVLDVDILDIQEGLTAVSEDPILLCDVLYMLCQEQAESLGVSDEQFGQALVGEAIESACSAFVEALMDFSPPRRRKILQAMQTTAVTLEETLAGLAETKIPHALQKIQDVLHGSISQDSVESLDTNQQEH